jgi:hypothetical protein
LRALVQVRRKVERRSLSPFGPINTVESRGEVVLEETAVQLSGACLENLIVFQGSPRKRAAGPASAPGSPVYGPPAAHRAAHHHGDARSGTLPVTRTDRVQPPFLHHRIAQFAGTVSRPLLRR